MKGSTVRVIKYNPERANTMQKKTNYNSSTHLTRSFNFKFKFEY